MEEGSMTKFKIDFHDRSPVVRRESRAGMDLGDLLAAIGEVTHFLTTPVLTQIDLETSRSVGEVQRLIADKLTFVGQILIDNELMIVRMES